MKENKELLTYLLFEAHDEQGYIQLLKADIDESFAAVDAPMSKAKKEYRKILRGINRQIKYIGSKSSAVELYLHYCTVMRNLDNHLHPKLEVIYQQQLNKVEKLIPLVDEDLQFEYTQQLESLKIDSPTPASNFRKRFFGFR